MIELYRSSFNAGSNALILLKSRKACFFEKHIQLGHKKEEAFVGLHHRTGVSRGRVLCWGPCRPWRRWRACPWPRTELCWAGAEPARRTPCGRSWRPRRPGSGAQQWPGPAQSGHRADQSRWREWCSPGHSGGIWIDRHVKVTWNSNWSHGLFYGAGLPPNTLHLIVGPQHLLLLLWILTQHKVLLVCKCLCGRCCERKQSIMMPVSKASIICSNTFK